MRAGELRDDGRAWRDVAAAGAGGCPAVVRRRTSSWAGRYAGASPSSSFDVPLKKGYSVTAPCLTLIPSSALRSVAPARQAFQAAAQGGRVGTALVAVGSSIVRTQAAFPRRGPFELRRSLTDGRGCRRDAVWTVVGGRRFVAEADRFRIRGERRGTQAWRAAAFENGDWVGAPKPLCRNKSPLQPIRPAGEPQAQFYTVSPSR